MKGNKKRTRPMFWAKQRGMLPENGRFAHRQGVSLKAQISTLIAAMPEGNLTMQALNL